MNNLSDLELPIISKDEEMTPDKMAMILDKMSKLYIKETPGILVCARKPFGVDIIGDDISFLLLH